MLIIEKVGKDSIEVEGNNRSQRFRYMGDVENPLSDLYNYGRVIRDLKRIGNSAKTLPGSFLNHGWNTSSKNVKTFWRLRRKGRWRTGVECQLG